MAVRRIIRMGHPTLRRVAREVTGEERREPAMDRLIEDIRDTLEDYGGIGLAAPQVDVSLRLAIIEMPGGQTRYGNVESFPLTVFFNPRIEVLDPATAGYWEGCLSVPGLRGYVERPQHIRVTYTDREGMERALMLRGFPATVMQHEFDHLDGRLYIDRLKDPSMLAFEDELVRYRGSEPAFD